MQGLIASPCTPAPGGTGRRGRSCGSLVGVGSKNVAKCFENLPAFLRKDFRNLLPRFARGGTTIARHCDFLSPLDPFLGSLAYRRVSVVTACFLCGFMPLYPWHASQGKISIPGLSQTSIVLPTAIPACVPWRLFLLPLRYVHWVHLVHQVHPAKCFVTRLAPQP